MDYRPRYTQPFTLEEARQLAVPIITEEIARLQNSLLHLQRTQRDLQEAICTSPDDTDLTEAYADNETVIGSQTERISLLRIVLAEKGISLSAHYNVVEPHRTQPETIGQNEGPPGTGDLDASTGTDALESGVYL